MWFKKSKSKPSRICRNTASLTGQPYDKFEPRNMLTITLVDGIVEVEGTLMDDVVDIIDNAENESNFVVTLNSDSETFAKEDVMRVRFRGRQGNDMLVNTYRR